MIEKDYEQYVKLGTPLEEADIINRFEIRLRNERAYYAVRDLPTFKIHIKTTPIPIPIDTSRKSFTNSHIFITPNFPLNLLQGSSAV